MNSTNHSAGHHQAAGGCPERTDDAVTVLFAAALEDDLRAEHELRLLALHSDHAADALAAVAYAHGLRESRALPPSPSEIASTDQLIAAVLDAVNTGP